jgi:transposase
MNESLRWVGFVASNPSRPGTGGIVKKCDREIMEILEAFDLTGCAHSAAQLAGCDEKTVSRYVQAREMGRDPFVTVERDSIIDPWRAKIEEWVDRSEGKVRADVVHGRLVAMGFGGSERTSRRAVAAAKRARREGRRRTYRPWITEPGMWLQFDWGTGPRIGGASTMLFCAWLAWSRFRVVIPTWDRTLGSLLCCVDSTLRLVGGAPAYVLTDNERTVTIDRIARVPIRHPELVAAGRHYGVTVRTCEPFDPETKGGSENTVKLAKADLVPTEVNLLEGYASFGELEAACEAFCERVNHRVHRETARRPVDMLVEERARLHVVPAEPYAAALGETRTVNDDQTVRFGSVRYSTPAGHAGSEVWCRVHGEQLIITARTGRGLREIARHQLSTPGTPRIVDAHYRDHPGAEAGPRPPRPRPTSAAERAFLGLGEGAHAWLVEAGAHGAQRVRTKMAHAVELATLVGSELVDRALGVAAAAGRFGEGDLSAIVEHLGAGGAQVAAIPIDESHSAQPGTASWEGFGR